MTRNILMATTAALTLIGGAAFAATDTDAADHSTKMTGEESAQASDMSMKDGMGHGRDIASAKLIRTRDITGGDIYSTADSQEWSADTEFTAVEDGWNDIGEIEDVVLDSKGQMIGVVAEIGGFLDIADKHVMIELDSIRLVPVDDESFAIVVAQSEEQLEKLPEVDEGFWD